MASASEERRDIVTEVALLTQQVSNLTTSVEDYQKKQADLIKAVSTLNDTWNQASGALNLIKWLVSAMAVLTALIAAVKAFAVHTH